MCRIPSTNQKDDPAPDTLKKIAFPNPTFFVDDGYSGTNYDRPGFQADACRKSKQERVAVCAVPKTYPDWDEILR
jgi:hypothetical protein